MSQSRSTAHPQNEVHAARWVEVLTNHPPLATFTSRITHKGFAMKRGPTARNVLNWNKRFLLLQEPFLSYFGSNDPKTPCRGTIYLIGARIDRLPHYPGYKNVLKIEPTVRRNLRQVHNGEDENNFYFSFETPRELEKWHEVLTAAASGTSAEAVLAVERDAHAHHLGGSASTGEGTSTNPSAVNLNATILEEEKDLENSSFFMSAPPPDDSGGIIPFATSPRASPRSIQSAQPTLSVEVKRKSFFNPRDTVRCRNTDHVHQMHCSVCKCSPIYGFMYSCVVCDDLHLCASCFREADHCPRHFFIVEPDLDGDSARLAPSLEGSCKPFRTVELVAFEAIFRTIAGSLPNTSTKPMPKRRLIAFWTQAINGGIGVDAIDEKLLLRTCRQPSTVEFDEFMLLVRAKLMRDRSDFAAVLEAFDTLTRMVDLTQGVAPEDDYVTLDTSGSLGQGHGDAEGPRSALRQLETCALNVYIGSCSADGVSIGFSAFLSLMMRVASVASGNDDITEEDVANLVPMSGQAETIEDTIYYVESLATRFATRLLELPPHHHRIVEGIETALLYDRQDGFGMYSQQSESFHPSFCDSCGVHPIIGYRYKCTVREDFDLCQRCFHTASASGGGQYMKLPGGIVVDAPKQFVARGGGGVDDDPTSPGGRRKRVQFEEI